MNPAILKSALLNHDKMLAKLEQELKVLKNQREMVLRELQRTCEHKEVFQHDGFAICYKKKNVQILSARRMCKLCGLKEFGLFTDFCGSRDEYAKVLTLGAEINITADCVFKHLGSPDKIEKISEDNAVWDLELPS